MRQGVQSSIVWTALGFTSAEYAWPANLGASAMAEYQTLQLRDNYYRRKARKRLDNKGHGLVDGGVPHCQLDIL